MVIGKDDVLKCLVDSGILAGDPQVSPDVSLYERGLIDSLGTMTLISELQRRFDIFVPETDLLPSNFDTVNDIARYVNRRKQEAVSS